MTEKHRRRDRGLLCDNNSVTRVNLSDFFEKLGFQDKILSKETILFIHSKVLWNKFLHFIRLEIP